MKNHFIKIPGVIRLLLVFTQVIALLPLTGQESSRGIHFPDVPGYRTLKCDFHMHTVFSDGSVWPNIRVQEAVREGLDAIAITDHLENQPHRKEIPNPDLNHSYALAARAAAGRDLIVIPGIEITRSMPPGHANALFIQDANLLDRKDVMEVYREARRQGAFIFWNHPHWTSQRPDGIATLTEMNRQMIREGLIQGIEIYNEDTYSDEAFQIALDHNLTILGNSDVHGLVEWHYGQAEGSHRPVTLVFASEKSTGAIKDALEQGRTVVWFGNTLAGRNEYLEPLIRHSLELKRQGTSIVQPIWIENHSDATYILENLSEFTLHNHASVFMVEAHARSLIQVKTVEKADSLMLRFKVLNAFAAPGIHPELTFVVE